MLIHYSELNNENLNSVGFLSWPHEINWFLHENFEYAVFANINVRKDISYIVDEVHQNILSDWNCYWSLKMTIQNAELDKIIIV